MIVLDTNVVSEVIGARPDARVVEWLDAQTAGGVYLTAVTVGELAYGVARLPQGRRRDRIADAVDDLVGRYFRGRVLGYDVAAARHYGALCAAREAIGRPISVADAQIAAICLAHRAALATRNTKDFWDLGIELVDPWTDGTA